MTRVTGSRTPFLCAITFCSSTCGAVCISLRQTAPLLVLLCIPPTGLPMSCTTMTQDPPPEEYDQMLAFYYKWQEKDRVCLRITAVGLAVDHLCNK
jgi:hypothetical protein